MAPWVWWLVVAAGLAAAEMFTLTLVLALVAVGAVLAAGVALLGGDVTWQLAVFALASAGLVGFVRPVARRHLRQPLEIRTGVAALVGRQAVVVERTNGSGGRVKLAGEIWSARTYDPGHVLQPGTPVDVIEIEGATALVYPRDGDS